MSARGASSPRSSTGGAAQTPAGARQYPDLFAWRAPRREGGGKGEEEEEEEEEAPDPFSMIPAREAPLAEREAPLGDEIASLEESARATLGPADPFLRSAESGHACTRDHMFVHWRPGDVREGVGDHWSGRVVLCTLCRAHHVCAETRDNDIGCSACVLAPRGEGYVCPWTRRVFAVNVSDEPEPMHHDDVSHVVRGGGGMPAHMWHFMRAAGLGGRRPTGRLRSAPRMRGTLEYMTMLRPARLRAARIIADALVFQRSDEGVRAHVRALHAGVRVKQELYAHRAGAAESPIHEMAMYMHATAVARAFAPLPFSEEAHAWVASMLNDAWDHFVIGILMQQCEAVPTPDCIFNRFAMAILYQLPNGYRMRVRLPRSGHVTVFAALPAVPALRGIPPTAAIKYFVNSAHAHIVRQQFVSRGTKVLQHILDTALARIARDAPDDDAFARAVHELAFVVRPPPAPGARGGRSGGAGGGGGAE